MAVKRETLNLVAASVFVAALLGMLVFLVVTPVPPANKGVVLTLTAALVGGMTTAMPRIFGTADYEREADRREIARLRETIKVLEGKYNVLKQEHDKVVSMLVERHIVHAEGIVQGNRP